MSSNIRTFCDVVEKANDNLMFCKFEDCLDHCHKSISEINVLNATEGPGKSEFLAKCNLAIEALCLVGIQAYAELNQWQEVVPFITKTYNGIEDCPANVLKFCILIHARMQDYPTCTAITNVWLRSPKNHDDKDYCSIVDTFVTHIFIPLETWEDIPTFVNSCPGLTQDMKEVYMKQLNVIRRQEEMNRVENIERVSDDDDTEPKKLLSTNTTQSGIGGTGFVAYIHRICQWTKQNFAVVFINGIKYFSAFAVILYILITRANIEFLSWKQLHQIWDSLAKLWKQMFAPFYTISR